jgi:hypothetical protein
LATKGGDGGASWLLVDETFRDGDPRFLGELFKANAEKKLQAFAERWYRDPRPFARETLRQYVLDGCERPHHRPLIKKLFKTAEGSGDDALMGAFMVAFDRYLHRAIVEVPYYDWSARESKTRRVLQSTGAVPGNQWSAKHQGTFSRDTRAYLMRRAWRYFRKLAKPHPDRYLRGVIAALLLYQDEHLEKPEQLLDAWGFLHVCYYGSPALDRRPRGAKLLSSLADLTPAPYAPKLWQGRFEEILDLFLRALARAVRTFAKALLERDYAAELARIDLGRIRRMLKSPHDDVQLFAVERLKTAGGLDALAIEEWLELLAMQHPVALPIIVELFETHVAPSRLELDQCVKLAGSPTGPVADLGLRWVQQRKVQGEAQIAAVLPLAEARAPHTRDQAAAWLVKLLEQTPAAKPEHLREVIDSRFEDAREKALPLLQGEGRFQDSPVLWAALAESPYPEIRAFLIDHLEKKLPHLRPFSLHHLWATALLAVHRGAKEKRRTLKLIAERLVAGKDDPALLAPLVRVSLRSVRPAERRAALATIARAAHQRPELRRAVALHFPELELGPEEAVCK